MFFTYCVAHPFVTLKLNVGSKGLQLLSCLLPVLKQHLKAKSTASSLP